MKSLQILTVVSVIGSVISSYAPSLVQCPSTPLVRLTGSVQTSKRFFFNFSSSSMVKNR